MPSNTTSKLIVLLSISIFLFAPVIIRADEASSTAATQAQLQQQLQAIQQEIDQFQQQLSVIQGEKNTLQNKLNSLKKQQASLQLQIQASNLKIADLTQKISDTQLGIQANQLKSELLEQQIGGAVRAINEQDSQPFLYTVVEQGSLSDILTQVQDYASVSDNLKALLIQARDTKTQLQQQEQDFTQQQSDAQNYLSIQALQEKQLGDTVGQQNDLLQQTKGKESDYQITLNDTKRRAAEIQNRIYDLLGITTQITFGNALKIAQFVSTQTGVEPAFLLAILTQESNLGKNVGTCNRPGDPPEKSYKVVMKPNRDIQPFLQITSDLGLDPDVTPVSCPMKNSKGKQVGWGGAMGPAQFIPSTWMGYKDQVSSVTGKTANPWDIRDAFLAAGIKLRANGADNTQQGEWNAAMRYFSGGTNVAYRFYGDNVIAQTQQYESDIAALGQ